MLVPVRNHICSVDSRLGKNCPEQYSELAKVDDVDSRENDRDSEGDEENDAD